MHVKTKRYSLSRRPVSTMREEWTLPAKLLNIEYLIALLPAMQGSIIPALAARCLATV